MCQASDVSGLTGSPQDEGAQATLPQLSASAGWLAQADLRGVLIKLRARPWGSGAQHGVWHTAGGWRPSWADSSFLETPASLSRSLTAEQ